MHPLMAPHSNHNMLHASRYMCDNAFTDDCEMLMIAQAYLPQPTHLTNLDARSTCPSNPELACSGR